MKLLKIITTNHVSKYRIINTVIASHFLSKEILKELIVRTDIVTREVIFIVTYAHFEHEFDNIVEALIKYNEYV